LRLRNECFYSCKIADPISIDDDREFVSCFSLEVGDGGLIEIVDVAFVGDGGVFVIVRFGKCRFDVLLVSLSDQLVDELAVFHDSQLEDISWDEFCLAGIVEWHWIFLFV
jgi:hypothetical protein